MNILRKHGTELCTQRSNELYMNFLRKISTELCTQGSDELYMNFLKKNSFLFGSDEEEFISIIIPI